MNTDQTGAHNTGVVLGGKGECGMDIEYTVHLWREGQQFVAHAMPLDVMSCGPTADQARQALVEAVELFLATAADVRTLDEVLVEAGYQPSNNAQATMHAFREGRASFGTVDDLRRKLEA